MAIHQWSGGDLGQYASWLNWDPASVKSPAWGSSPIERQKADGTWFNSVNWRQPPDRLYWRYAVADGQKSPGAVYCRFTVS
ncbi:hypothetical protein FPL16_01595 [Salmonella enterica subsp. enterica serovar Typhimurium]|nr:hypothetical protein FPL16_01595 [Salmonella enterica subsp. enterica serovar Typhimurium]